MQKGIIFFDKIQRYFRNCADFECDNVKLIDTRDVNEVADESPIVYKQSPELNAYYSFSDLDKDPEYGYNRYPFGQIDVGWFVDERVKSQKRRFFIFENTDMEILMRDVDQVHFNKSNRCWLCEKRIEPVGTKIKDPRHLTSQYRGVAHED